MIEEEEDILVDIAWEGPGEAAPSRRRRGRGVWIMAGAVSLVMHGALLAAGMTLLGHVFTPPRVELSWGDAGGGEAGEVMGAAQEEAGPSQVTPSGPAQLPEMPVANQMSARVDASALDRVVLDQPVGSAVAIGVGAVSAEALSGEPSDGLPFPSFGSQGNGPRIKAALPAVGSGEQVLGPMPLASGGSGSGHGGSGAMGGGIKALPQPIYPRECRLRGEEGTVVLEIEVTAEGRIGQITVVDDAGHPRLAESAVAAVKHATVTPAMEDGRPVAVWLRTPFVFVLR